MRRGYLSDLFVGVVAKRLTLVETITKKSNQHEIQGTAPFRHLFGLDDRRGIRTHFIWLSGEQEALTADGFMSWSNVRKGKPRSPEYHLYYSTNPVTEMMDVDDILFLALRRDRTLLAIVAPRDSTIQSQLRWLFGLQDHPLLDYTFQKIDRHHDAELDFAARYILEELEIEPEEPEGALLDSLVDPFGLEMPATRVLSQLARTSLPEVSVLDDPDRAILEWMDREEQLFRRLERRLIMERLRAGFAGAAGADVEGFISFSLSVQNRRKARAGQALENHLEAAFLAMGVRFARGVITENKNRPDFLFPGQKEYHDPGFPESKLTMLGAKSTAKERWRQVLSEAGRIPEKHLLTLEPGISENQTNEMRAKLLRLVLPRGLHETYLASQRAWLMSFADFVRLVAERQDAGLHSPSGA